MVSVLFIYIQSHKQLTPLQISSEDCFCALVVCCSFHTSLSLSLSLKVTHTNFFLSIFLSFFLSFSVGGTNNMRNPLDLNNFPDDFTRDHGKQPLDDSSSSASGIYRKKKNGAKDESAKVYECRFCSLKFCKSQALGGHMNRHRQERETETLNRARQLVFSNDNLLPHQLGGQPVVQGGFHHHHHHNHQPSCNMASTVYPTRLFSGNSPAILPQAASQPAPPHLYASPGSRLNGPYSSQYPPPSHDYFVGHVCSNNQPFSLQNNNGSTAPPADSSSTTNYTCIGAPVGQSFPLGGGSGGGRDMSPSTVNRYHQDGF